MTKPSQWQSAAIDRLNKARHHIVEEIDAAIDRAVTQTASAPLATESPAMAFDRLSVLVIRIHHTERAVGEGVSDPISTRRAFRSCTAAVGPPASHRRSHRGCSPGTRRFVPYQSLKMYGQ